MKLTSILALLPVFVLSFEAQAFTQWETFVCQASKERIKVKSSLLQTGKRSLSAQSPTIGVMKKVDCAEITAKFDKHGFGEEDACLLSEDGVYLLALNRNLNEARWGRLTVFGKHNGFDICIKDDSSSIQ